MFCGWKFLRYLGCEVQLLGQPSFEICTVYILLMKGVCPTHERYIATAKYGSGPLWWRYVVGQQPLGSDDFVSVSLPCLLRGL
jgi:hypothetical protein